ncbi:MAG TPA: TIGR01897 family CRISPR-associated protein [Caldanaerobacter subterraneus]|uniref:TIGR01897 family CRISPR-associated protein n=1 Tax=Caldanaerobacter subterraneus TaxID=911092 RepID=A0A357VKT6_9THEO|nr:CRISPR-associated CARF protein Csx1 [Caldanaerobacter subterraneus]HBT48527.1 TIGR01897 family CRISPR-associated protein [Caldanaerobacter subterraneus]
MKVIYQIGRFDKGFMKTQEFTFRQEKYTEVLTSFVMKKFFQKKNPQEKSMVVLIFPVSLILNESAIKEVIESNDEAIEKFKEKLERFKDMVPNTLQEYSTDPYAFYSFHPHCKIADDFFVIHSLGGYKIFGEYIEFNSDYNDIVLQIFSDMAIRYLNEYNRDNETMEFYIDISSGHNIYISALLEAARYFSVFSGLLNWLKKEKRPKIFLAFSDPILPGTTGMKEYEIHIEELRFKTFFSSPIGKEELDNFNLARRIAGKEKELKNVLQKLFEKFLICFSAIKNNTPLVLYYCNFDVREDVISFLKNFLEMLKQKLSRSWNSSPGLSKADYLNTILSLGFYAGILEVLEARGISKYDYEKGIALEGIKQLFASEENSIYELFELGTHVSILGKEIRNLCYGGKEKSILNQATEEWNKVYNFIDEGEPSSFEDRNFLAHAGFERNVTEVRKKEGKLYLRYDKNLEKKFLDCLKKHV